MDLILFWIGTRIESVLLLPSTGSTIKSRRIGGAACSCACSCVVAGGGASQCKHCAEQEQREAAANFVVTAEAILKKAEAGEKLSNKVQHGAEGSLLLDGGRVWNCSDRKSMEK